MVAKVVEIGAKTSLELAENAEIERLRKVARVTDERLNVDVVLPKFLHQTFIESRRVTIDE